MRTEHRTVTTVTNHHHGVFMNTTFERKEVVERDFTTHAKNAISTVYAFSYADTVHQNIVHEGKVIKHRFKVRVNPSPLYFIDAVLLDLASVEALSDDFAPMIAREMRLEEWSLIIRCRTGQFHPYDPDQYELISTQ